MRTRNKWKIAFWIQFCIFIGTALALIYIIFDQSVTITYMQDGYRNTERDLMQVSSVMQGKLNKQDFKEIINSSLDYKDEDIELNRIKISFGSDGKIDTITTKW